VVGERSILYEVGHDGRLMYHDDEAGEVEKLRRQGIGRR
jgi:hypothetical protein